jgi:hypothetical protein
MHTEFRPAAPAMPALLDVLDSRNFLFRAYVTLIAGQGTSPSGVDA